MQGFGNLNKFLKQFLIDLKEEISFEEDELRIFMDQIYEYVLKILEQEQNLPEKFSNPRKLIKEKETISLVDDFLSDLDTDLERKFIKALDQGVIHLTKEKSLKGKKANTTNCYYFHSLAGFVDGNPFVNVVTQNRINDAFTLLHEFSHFANMGTTGESNLSWHLFTEGYATIFETMLLDFLKNTKLESEANRYYLSLLWSFLIRSLNFIKEYYALDMYLTYKKIDDKRIYKYVKDNEDAISYFYSFKQAMIALEENLNKYDQIFSFFEDYKYVLAIPFTESAITSLPKRKKEIIEDYKLLNTINHKYYFDKYEMDKIESYEKVFKRGNL